MEVQWPDNLHPEVLDSMATLEGSRVFLGDNIEGSRNFAGISDFLARIL